MEQWPSLHKALGLSLAPYTARILLYPGVAGHRVLSSEHSSSGSLIGMIFPRGLGQRMATQEIKCSMSQNRINQVDGSNLFQNQCASKSNGAASSLILCSLCTKPDKAGPLL